MRIGSFYQGKETGTAYRLKGFTVSLFTKDFITLELKAEYLLKLHKEHAYTFSVPINIEATQGSFAKTPPVISELLAVIEKFVSELTSHGHVLSAPSEDPEPNHPSSSESAPAQPAVSEHPLEPALASPDLLVGSPVQAPEQSSVEKTSVEKVPQ